MAFSGFSDFSRVTSVGRLARGAACVGFVAVAAFGAITPHIASAQVAAGTTGIDATGNAASEMAACNNGQTQQDPETCMKEVRNANADKRAGRLNNAGGQFGANAAQRCEALTGEQKIACEARVIGIGSTQGSVAEGGVIREVETVVVPADGSAVRVQPKTDSIVVIPGAR